MSHKFNKTVFILGAGFSRDAGAPPQEGLIKSIFELDKSDPSIFRPNSISDFRKLLTETFSIPENLYNQIPLEDIFTPLDKCSLDNISFRNLSIDEVKIKREEVVYLIAKMLKEILTSSSKDYIDKFAMHLVEKCEKRKEGNYGKVDAVSVITTNWDILLDTSIQKVIDDCHIKKAVVDYCCHISSFNEHDDRVKPGLEILGKGGFNVKVLKLHGSLNWLHCPRCQRLYVDPENKISVDQWHFEAKCRHCEDNFGHENSHILTSNIIIPTFLKNLSNPQYKIIWQNAGIELSEASKIIFVGYSLPQADFELRQLFSRMVRKDVEIEVVGYSKNPIGDKDFEDLKTRYESFFGNRLKLPVFQGGAREYFLNHLS